MRSRRNLLCINVMVSVACVNDRHLQVTVCSADLWFENERRVLPTIVDKARVYPLPSGGGCGIGQRITNPENSKNPKTRKALKFRRKGQHAPLRRRMDAQIHGAVFRWGLVF